MLSSQRVTVHTRHSSSGGSSGGNEDGEDYVRVGFVYV